MFLVCKCGGFKHYPPYRNNAKRPWICPQCRTQMHKPVEQRPVTRSRLETKVHLSLLERTSNMRNRSTG